MLTSPIIPPYLDDITGYGAKAVRKKLPLLAARLEIAVNHMKDAYYDTNPKP